MTKMRPTLAAVLAFGLAGCGNPAAPTTTESAPATGATPAAVRGIPVATKSEIFDAGDFPAGFQGKWGMTEADCDPSRSDAKGMMRIERDTLTFYESRGKIAAIAETSQSRITADIALTGEGQEWKTRTTFALENGGTSIVRTEQSPPITARYTRC